jgi:hypothetical protein
VDLSEAFQRTGVVQERGEGVAAPNRTRWKGGEEGSSVGLLGFVWMG